MLEALLSFLALAFVADSAGEAEQEEAKDKARKRFFPDPEGVTRERLAKASWLAYREQLERYEDDWDREPDAGPELVALDAYLEQTNRDLPPGLEWDFEYVHDPWRKEDRVKWNDRAKHPIANHASAAGAERITMVTLSEWGPTVAVWQYGREDWNHALNEAADWAETFAPGVFVRPDYPENLEEIEEQHGQQAMWDAMAEAEADLNRLDGDRFLGYNVGVTTLHDPFSHLRRSWRRSPASFDLRKVAMHPDTHVWMAYKVRSAQD